MASALPRVRTVAKRALRALLARVDFALVPQRQLRSLEVQRVALRSGAGQVRETLELCRALGRPVSFVQVGANDGVESEAFLGMVEEFGLEGVLVEPQPKAFGRLVENYRDVPGLAFENVAISDGPDTLTLHSFDRPLEDGHRLDVFTSFSRAIVEKQKRRFGLEAEIVSAEVPALGLSELLDRHEVEEGYVLVVDTEGFDHRVVAQVDFERRPPLLIQFEHVHIPLDELESCYRTLVGRGYRLTRAEKDTVAVRPLAGEGGPPVAEVAE